MKYKVKIIERYFVVMDYEVEADNEDDAEEEVDNQTANATLIANSGYEYEDCELLECVQVR